MTEKPRWLDDFQNVKKLVRVFLVICTVLALPDILVWLMPDLFHIFERHTEHPWEWLPAFFPLYGFIACVGLVLGAKEMRKVVMRKEEYYDD